MHLRRSRFLADRLLRAAPRPQLPPHRRRAARRPVLRCRLRGPVRGARPAAPAARHALAPKAEGATLTLATSVWTRCCARRSITLRRPAGVHQTGAGAVPPAARARRARHDPLRRPGGGARRSAGAAAAISRRSSAPLRARARTLARRRHRHRHRQRAREPGVAPRPGRLCACWPPTWTATYCRSRRLPWFVAPFGRETADGRPGDPAPRPALVAGGGATTSAGTRGTTTAPSVRSSRARSCTSCAAASSPTCAPSRTRPTTGPSTARRSSCFSPAS